MSQPTGGPAFPVHSVHCQHAIDDPSYRCFCGMSLRDWFAGMALQTLDLAVIANIAKQSKERETELLAKVAYDFADAMLTRREEQP